MKLLKLQNFLPDTASAVEHPKAKSLKDLLDNLAKGENTSVILFDVSDKGVAVFGLADDQALGRVAAQFREEKDVVVSETTMISFEREKNRVAQEKVDKTRNTRKSKAQ